MLKFYSDFLFDKRSLNGWVGNNFYNFRLWKHSGHRLNVMSTMKLTFYP